MLTFITFTSYSLLYFTVLIFTSHSLLLPHIHYFHLSCSLFLPDILDFYLIFTIFTLHSLLYLTVPHFYLSHSGVLPCIFHFYLTFPTFTFHSHYFFISQSMLLPQISTYASHFVHLPHSQLSPSPSLQYLYFSHSLLLAFTFTTVSSQFSIYASHCLLVLHTDYFYLTFFCLYLI